MTIEVTIEEATVEVTIDNSTVEVAVENNEVSVDVTVGGGIGRIADASDTNFSSLNNGDQVVYDADTEKFVNSTSEVITVGPHGRFDTIAEALDYIALQPTMTLVNTSAHLELTQWDHYIPLTNPGTDTLGDARPGDFVYITNDDPGVDAFQYDWHYYRIYSAIQNDGESAPGLLVESGILGSSQSNILAEIRRPAEFTIQLLDGYYDTTGATMPDGYSIKIQGLGRLTKVGGGGIAMPVYGHTEFTGFVQVGSLTNQDGRTLDPTNEFGNGTLIDAGFSSLHQHDTWCEGEDVFITGNSSFQSLRIKNLDLSGFKGHRIYFFLNADFMQIENVRYETVSSMETVEVFTHPRRQSSSWTKVVRNCSFKRVQDISGNSGIRANFVFGVNLPQDNMPDYRMDFYNCIIEDRDLKAQASDGHLLSWQTFTNSSNIANIRFIDCELNNINSHDFDIGSEYNSFDVGSTMNIEFINSYNYDVVNKTRKQITSEFTALIEPSIYYRNSNSHLSAPFAGFLVPSVAQAEAVIYDVMTSAVTVLNPVGGIQGETKKLVFEQDVVGGHAITWSGSEYRIHSNPVGTAGQKAVFDLYFDGANWTQIGATGWA